MGITMVKDREMIKIQTMFTVVFSKIFKRNKSVTLSYRSTNID